MPELDMSEGVFCPIGRSAWSAVAEKTANGLEVTSRDKLAAEIIASYKLKGMEATRDVVLNRYSTLRNAGAVLFPIPAGVKGRKVDHAKRANEREAITVELAAQGMRPIFDAKGVFAGIEPIPAETETATA